jgi:uncharacterized membrane protein
MNMDATQYLAFIPLLIYGLGLTTLMSDWKRHFDLKHIYWPYTLLSMVITEVAVYNVFIYIQLIAKFKEQTYLTYLSYLISPFLFYLSAQVFTPDPGINTKEYFVKRMPLFSSLFALLTASHFMNDIVETEYSTILRIVFIVLMLVVGFSKKPMLSYLLVFVWAISLIIRGTISHS